MTVLAVTFDGTRLHTGDAADTSTDPTAADWLDIGGGKGSSTEPDFIYQGPASVSVKVGTSEGGISADFTATVDYATGPKVWLAKHIATNSSALNVKGATGGILEIGSGGRRSAYDRYYVIGGDTYPIKGGWLITPIDPNGGNQSARPGSAPTLSAIDYYGWACDFTATSKSENVALDAIDHITNGSGLTLVSGTSGDTNGAFSDFVLEDEGISTNRWGVVSSGTKEIIVTGVLTVGTATETDFTDSNQVLVFPEAEFLNTVGFFGVNLGLQHASSVISITDCVFASLGTVGGSVDTRPDYVVTGTSGAGTYDGCSFDVFRVMTLTSGMTLQDCVLLNGLSLVQAGATIDGCVFASATTGDGVAFITSDDPDLISNCDFTFSDGHAIEITVAGTYGVVNNVFTGYGADGTNDAAIYNNSGGAVTLNVSGGASPTVRNGASATTSVLNTVTVTVTCLDAKALTAIENSRVLMLVATGGPLPFEESVTITRSATTATVTHTAHGVPDGSKVQIKGADQEDYNCVAVVSVTGVNEYTYTVSNSPTTPATGTIESTAVILDGLTNVSGILEDTGLDFPGVQPISGRARKGTSTPFYQSAPLVGTITDQGLSVSAFLVPDE